MPKSIAGTDHKPNTQVLADRYFVQLQKAPLSRFMQSQSASAKQSKVNSSAQALKLAYVAELSRAQQKFVTVAKAHITDLQIEHQYQFLFNGLAVKSSRASAAKLASLPGVKAVYPVKKRYISATPGQQVIKAPQAWSLVGGQQLAGKGIKIAVIDTGIRNDNPMFSDGSVSEWQIPDDAYVKQHPDYCRSENGDPQFCNQKLIVARWIDPAQHGLWVYEKEHMSPLGFNGHGSHVAGIALGTPVNIEFNGVNQQVGGVAPASYLMIYKALYVEPGGAATGTDTMLLEALELAVKDGADIINNSWGRPLQLIRPIRFLVRFLPMQKLWEWLW
ncbi:S8 family serine peptidase [Neptunicella marina]|uniref:S8 family serine peptidase n=1 Tax=Neptunicella marina TaxID=2125989 RepID=A0A8J6IV36_9ALTE|nr:S8 family serine peptidase [Neptunicella marina]MBC3767251.1 S8 family serine peptidase [Neptunicella marina]